jgi:hypothetical protein
MAKVAGVSRVRNSQLFSVQWFKFKALIVLDKMQNSREP